MVSEKKLNLRCPKCGSDEIVEWEVVPTSHPIQDVFEEPDGSQTVEYTGEANHEYDAAQVEGYACRWCADIAPSIETFVVGDNDE